MICHSTVLNKFKNLTLSACSTYIGHLHFVDYVLHCRPQSVQMYSVHIFFLFLISHFLYNIYSIYYIYLNIVAVHRVCSTDSASRHSIEPFFLECIRKFKKKKICFRYFSFFFFLVQFV